MPVSVSYEILISMKYRIIAPDEVIEDGVVTLPLSKSLSTRQLILDALTPDLSDSGADSIARCDDTDLMVAALRQGSGTINVGASGAALRFLTAYFAAKEGAEVVLQGTERLHQRPVAILVDALRSCGADIEYLDRPGFAPLKVKGRQLAGGTVTVDVTVSSQFVSALLMVAPTMTNGLTINYDGEPTSLPYITMTIGMMEQRGVAVEREPMSLHVPRAAYRPYRQPAEGDWSAAAFWYEIVALTAGWITLSNLKNDSLQGDRATSGFFDCLGVCTNDSEEHPGGLDLCPSPEVFGRLDLDLADNPDLAPALAVTCCMINVPFKFVGLHNLCLKESDRLQAICEEMAKAGFVIEKVRDFGLEWEGKTVPITRLPEFSAHNDHRIAMALAPVSAYLPGITIDGCEAVSKSYPEYWEQLRAIGFRVDEVKEADEANEVNEETE